MKVCLIRAQIPALDPTDDPSSNGFVFKSASATDFTDAPDLFTHVKNFYNVTGTGGTNALHVYMGPQLDRGTNHSTVTLYDITSHLDGSPHGSPIAADTWTLAASGQTDGAPSGVAAAISYRADYGTDVEFGPHTRPRARDRARLYIGPLTRTTPFNSDSVTKRCIFDGTFITDALAALFNLSESVDTSGNDWALQVWSRVNAGTKLPTEGWMDNRPDYQRRRSDPSPGSRVFRPLASV